MIALRRVGEGRRSELADLYWLASHGQQLPREAWPAVLFARQMLGEPYAWSMRIAEVLQEIGVDDGTEV